MNKKNILLFIPLIICVSFFISIKLLDLGIRLSDTNIYFLTGKELLSGKILYKDIFFTNFPLIPYIASFYFFISNGNLLFYYFTAVLEIALTSGIIFYLSFKESSSRLTATTTLILYLFSFMILSTSSHQTGVFLAALFGVVSYFFFTKKNYYLVGVSTALALLTKAYSLPLFISYFLLYLLHNRKALIRFLSGSGVTMIIILLPSLIFASHSFFQDVFAYSLTRSEGVTKAGIIYFLIQHDFLFLCLLISSLLLFKKKSFFGFFAGLSFIFFFFYKDVYYLYLNVTLPLIILSYPLLLKGITKKIVLNRFMLPTIVLIFTIYNLLSYFNGFNDLQKIPLNQIAGILKEHKISSIYGINGIAPAIAYESNIPLLDGIIDTNDNIFRKGYLNASLLTQDAIKNHSGIITIGAWYPEVGIKQDVLTEIVDQKLLTTNCHLLQRFPFHSEGIINSINVFSC
jgi:hypothetical protein